MNKKRLALLTLGLPFLLANAPAPQYASALEEYDSFSYTNWQEHEWEGGKYHSLEVTNTGTGYALASSFYFVGASNTGSNVHGDSLSYGRVIAPGEKATLFFREDFAYVEGITTRGSAYVGVKDTELRFNDVEWGAVQSGGSPEYGSCYSYSFNMDLEDGQPTIKNTAIIYTVKYEEETYSFYNKNITAGSYSFELDKRVDVSKLEISSVKQLPVTSSYYQDNHGSFDGILVAIFGTAAAYIIVIGLLGLIFVGGIIVGIVFLIRDIVKKNKKKKAAC